MTESCEKVRDQIALEGGLPDDPGVRRHLERCGDCTRFLDSVRAVEEALAALPDADASDRVVEKLLARPELRRRGGRRRVFHWAMGVAAAAMIGFVAVSVTFRSRDLERDAQTTVAAESPAVEPTPDVVEGELEALPGLAGRLDDKDDVAPKKRVNEDRARRMVRPDESRELDAPVLEEREALPEVRQEAKKENVPAPAPLPAEGSVVKDEGVVGGKLGHGSFGPPPEKRVDVAPEYPEAARRDGIEGTVTLELTIDPEGNVVDAKVLKSIPALDEAALEAVRQWKYAPFEGKVLRTVLVEVPFELDDPGDDFARRFLDERWRIEGLRFQEPRGYWANTYLPGDPKLRLLTMRLRNAHGNVAPHAMARPVAEPYDPPSRGALSVFLRADRRGISRPSRLLVQVGLQATEAYGRRRPPMNVGIVIDTDAAHLGEMRALLGALLERKTLGDRFRLIVPGRGEVVAPGAFRHGPLTLALEEPSSGDLVEAVRLAMKKVHVGDDPSMPLGTSLVLIATARPIQDTLRELVHLAHRSAVGGVPVSVIGMGSALGTEDRLERLALAGQGRLYVLDRSEDSGRIVGGELAATSRAVARALRLRIKLAPGVKLVDVLGSEPLSARQTKRVKEAEKSIDLRLARNLGIEADRGEDEDGIQIVIPSFYAGDSHTILLDVVASGPGPIAEVTVRYKDLAELRNTVSMASLSLPRGNPQPGPLETNVFKNYLAFYLSQELTEAASELERGDAESAVARLERTRRLFAALRLGSDGEIARDVSMLSEYITLLTSRSGSALHAYLADSLWVAGAAKLHPPLAWT